jgi:hypothetical protein
MSRIVIRGLAAVFDDDVRITDPSVLRKLSGVRYDGERFTDYLGGPPEEDALAEALEPGGGLSFEYADDGGDCLVATTEYSLRRALTDAELALLVDYTMGQWSDGIGENWSCDSKSRCGYTIMCLTQGDTELPRPYPSVAIR